MSVPGIGDAVIYSLADGDDVPAQILSFPQQGYANIRVYLGQGEYRRYDYVRVSRLGWPNGEECDQDQDQGFGAA
jgi:hypothetical protein